jgi:hypothetical protein
MPTNQLFPFVPQVHAENKAITESHCLLCGVLVAASPQDKYLAIAESAHKCLNSGRALAAANI